VNIWASWCGPCKVEAPNLARAAREFGRRIQFIGVDIMDKRGAAAQFIRSEGWLYPSVFDPTGSIKTGLGFLGQPDTLFFDPTGRQVSISAGGTTVHAWSGPITLTALRAILPQLLRH
jgi:thiol-disulfide isomerase/thioredoxin